MAIRTASNAQLCSSSTMYGMYIVPKTGSTLSNFYSIQNGSMVENSNGTATFTATVVNNSNANVSWTINATLTGRTYSTPSGSPKAHNCLAYSTADWVYYTGMTGTLTGGGNIANALYNFSRTGAAFQIGTGANVQDGMFGASAWFNYTYVSGANTFFTSNFNTTGSGDFNYRVTGAKLPSTCNNVTSGGTISGAESICGGYNPGLISSSTLPSGGNTSATMEYIWLQTTDPNTAAGSASNYTTIAGATGTTYDPSSITVTTWYRRCARRQGCTTYAGESNWIKKEVKSLPSATASNGGAANCAGTILLYANGGSSYNWAGPGGYTSTMQNPTRTNATATMAGTYTVTVTGSNGCTATATTNVTVNCTNPTPPCAGNLVVNPGFENGTISWSSW
ncbi:MAG: hypothetical protein ACKVTZ_09205, partial [Bacteroidia bacterium]